MSEFTKRLVSILSPVRPKQVRMASGLGDLAAQLRGGTQRGGQLLNQLAGKPGVKQGALAEYFGHIDPDAKYTPTQLAAAVRNPRLFAQRGMADNLDEDALMEAASDIAWGDHPEIVLMRREELETMLREVMAQDSPHGELSTQARSMLANRVSDDADLRSIRLWEAEATRVIDSHFGEGTTEDMYFEGPVADTAYSIAKANMPRGRSIQPAYSTYQRQPGLTRDTNSQIPYNEQPNYFETVLRGTPSRARGDLGPDQKGNWHFDNPAQLGHVRGSVTPGGNVYAEELQSDPLEDAPNLPALQGIYGKLGRMLIDRSAEAGAPSVSFPNADRIASVRNQAQLPFFRSVYDKDLAKQLYAPLAKRGVPLRQENGWTTMDLPEGVLNAIKNDGLLNYKRGGPV